MTFTYTAGASAKDNVRLIITDTDETYPLFTDEEIAAFLAMAANSVLLAAAMALETMARSEVLVLKVIKLLDLQTDGASVARELRMNAKLLRDQAADESTELGFSIAEMVDNPAGYVEKLTKDAQRQGY